MAEIVLRFLFSFLFQPWNSVSHIIVTQDLLIEGAKNIWVDLALFEVTFKDG